MAAANNEEAEGLQPMDDGKVCADSTEADAADAAKAGMDIVIDVGAAETGIDGTEQVQASEAAEAAEVQQPANTEVGRDDSAALGSKAEEMDTDMKTEAQDETTALPQDRAQESEDATQVATDAMAEQTEGVQGEDPQEMEKPASEEAVVILSAEARQKISKWKPQRKRGIAELVKKAERLEKEANRAQDVVGEHTLVLKEMMAEWRRQKEKLTQHEEKICGQQEKIQKQEGLVTSVRNAAAKVRQEVAIHDMPAAPPRPLTAFGIFCSSNGLKIAEGAKKWAEFSEEQKQKYRDANMVERREWEAWSTSDEGKALLAQRAAALKAQKSKSGGTSGTVASGLQAPAETSGQVAKPSAPDVETTQGAHTSPAKRKKAEPKKTPKKQRRTEIQPPRMALAPDVEVEASALEEANKLSLHSQLLNLAGRPEIQALKKSSWDVLAALIESKGMVNAAKSRLLDGPVATESVLEH